MCTALSKHLNHDNACTVFAAADSHHCGVLKQEAFSRIVQHFALATRSDGWLALTKAQLSEVYLCIVLRRCLILTIPAVYSALAFFVKSSTCVVE